MLPQRSCAFIRFRRHHDFQYRIQIAGLFFAHQTFAFNAQSLPGLAAWRDGILLFGTPLAGTFLQARLMEGEPRVLATGGGAFCDPETRARIKQDALSVWIRADLDLLDVTIGTYQDASDEITTKILDGDELIGAALVWLGLHQQRRLPQP